YDLVAGSGVPERIARWSREAEQEGLLDVAREHRQIWDGVVQLFDQLVETLGDERLSLEEYARILEAGVAGLRLSLIPPALDQVLVGSLDRSRNPDVRATFVLGVSDGVLPARQVEGGLFTDREREALLAAGLEVAPDARRRLYTEQYLVYIALTRASEYLWVSYPLADEEGRALAPSGVIGRLKELFPDLREETLPVEPQGTVAGADVPFVSVPDRTLGFLGTRLRAWRHGNPIDPLWWSVYNWFCGREAYKDGLGLVLRALFHENRNEPLDPERCRLLYGSPLVVSVTRLEKFRGCPFAHFACYGLRLRERAMCRLEAPDLGQFFHAALKGVEDRLAEQSLDWGALDAAECRRLAGQVVDGLAPRLRSEILLSSPRYRFLTGKLGRVVEHTTRALAAQAQQSRFRPVGWEIPFGRGHDVPPLVYELPGGGVLELAGRIDRVDVARTPARNFVRVVDYKAEGAVLRLDDVFYGLDIQLLVYLEACLRHAGKIVGGPCLPGGAFYFRVGSPMLRKRAPLSAAEIEPQLMKLYRMQGLVLEDTELVRLMDGAAAGESLIIPAGFNKDGGLRRKPNVLKLEHFERLREHLGRVIKDTGAAIGTGEVTAAPYRKGGMTACRYCPYKPVCGFDPLIASDRYRELRPVSGPEVWRLLGAPEEGKA
ncbi:MAG: PD-(D/E)XK nuclease family protein, partial [Candidatus Desulforudis sp.]|nr:PD-(D/E)XK nuclease family protein [Desulforudis sp.]